MRQDGRLRAWMLLAALAAGSSAGLAGEQTAIAAVSEPVAEQVWHTARSGQETQLAQTLEQLAEPADADAVNGPFRDSVALFESNLAKRETQRTEQIDKASTKLDELLTKWQDDHSEITLSDALASAVELQLLMPNSDDLLSQTRVVHLIENSDKAARAAESRGDWLVANELYYRLNTLLEQQGTYNADVHRLGTRLNMIRMYAPERLWELRNERWQAEEGSEPLPPYNSYGDDYHEKLAGVNTQMIYRALLRAASAHVGLKSEDNPDGVTMGTLLTGGLNALETMATTADLREPFEGLRDENARSRFLRVVRGLREQVDAGGDDVSFKDMRTVIEHLLDANHDSVRIADEAVLHEFGNGAMSVLDDYTAIIWPDELSRFRRSTQGEFIGVGIQIQLDELQNIKVVTPLEGTPAQRAGIRSGDVIKKVNGLSAVGLGLDQAVEVITGPPDTSVTLTVERKDEDSDESEELDFTVVRKHIDLPSVKGWRKTGPGDYDWDWFVDPDAGIGYVRLTGFTEDSARDFDRAVAVMRARGLNSLILDLRYNPGGLLDQAVEISSRFIPEGLVVRTETGTGTPTGEPMFAKPLPPEKSLANIPVVVLINEGSASASEITSGAIQAAAHHGIIHALVVGQRSFGKGSVQNVFALSGGTAAMKLTTQYYRIDSPRLIHRTPGATSWGIDPDLKVEMLPGQQVDALMLRRESDVLPLDEFGNIITDAERPDPDKLLTDGIDLQVQTALVLLQSQNTDPALVQAAGLNNTAGN